MPIVFAAGSIGVTIKLGKNFVKSAFLLLNVKKTLFEVIDAIKGL